MKSNPKLMNTIISRHQIIINLNSSENIFFIMMNNEPKALIYLS
jgi:hypothetical protein